MKNALFILCITLVFMSCNGTSQEQTVNENKDTKPITEMNVKDKSFGELFQPVDSAEITDRLTKLMVNEGHTVITAGTDSRYNSMMASWEILGQYFRMPMTLNLLGANRYTLELIREQQSYTLSFFPEKSKEDIMQFGIKSGRDSNKMEESKLTHVKTPSDNITYKEANIVIECSLFEITTIHPNDFYTENGRKFVEDALDEAKDYHKLVFGKITNVWIRK